MMPLPNANRVAALTSAARVNRDCHPGWVRRAGRLGAWHLGAGEPDSRDGHDEDQYIPADLDRQDNLAAEIERN